MRRRVLIAIISIATLAVVLFGLPLAIVVERFVDESATLRIERRAVLAARDVPDDFETSGDPVELPSTDDGTVLALYDSRGLLAAGNGPSKADETTSRALRNEVTDTERSGLRIVAVPVAADEKVVGAIRAEQSTAASDGRTRRIVALLGLLAAGVIVVGALIGYLVAGRLARPVQRLRDAAVRLGEGDFTIEVPRSRVPELDQAAEAMTNTARRLDDLVTRERSFSADASHQLRTPIAGLRAAMETELEFPRADATQVLQEALVDLDRIERTITELLTIARTAGTAPEQMRLTDALNEINTTWRGQLAARGRPLVIADAHDCPPVYGNVALLRHSLDVVVDNAMNHGAGEVRIELHNASETVTISICDEGPGFTVDAADDRHGLGLPLARRLVAAMSGRFVVARSGPSPRIDIVLRRADVS
ncbi:MAG TPA: HAMP domain-containing sensor histidine kinase [Ilumatobacteraceae bacterium]